MVIKLTQIIRNLGEIIFVVEYSDNAATKTVNIRKEEPSRKAKASAATPWTSDHSSRCARSNHSDRERAQAGRISFA